MVTIHQICYNEVQILEFCYNFYRSRFPKAKFVLEDNESNDGSVELAKSLGYEIKTFSTNNQMDDTILSEVRNNCWKNDKTDWVIVCDMDELIDVNEEILIQEQSACNTVIQTWGFQMISLEHGFNLEAIKYGFRDGDFYDKSLIFNKRFISNMNWSVGSHKCQPEGVLVKQTEKRYPLLHYKFINEEYVVKRYMDLNSRQSAQNIEKRMSIHYNISEQEIRENFNEMKKNHLTKLI